MADYDHVCRCLESDCSVEEEPKSPPLRKLADCADDGSPGRYSETFPPLGSVARFETVFEWHWQNGYRQAGCGTPEIAAEGGVRAQGRGQAPIEITVVGVGADVAGVTECTDQRGSAMGAGGDAQEVVVGEVTDEDVARVGQ